MHKVNVLGPATPLFRGQANSAWKLVPSLYRKGVAISPASIVDAYIAAEERMITAFFDRAHLLLPQFERDACVDRVIAQHYSIPTQLLDWTLDPLIALYFAVEDLHEEADAALYFMQPMHGIGGRAFVQFPFQQPISVLVPPIIDERVRTQKSVFTLQSFGGGLTFRPLEERALQDEVSLFGRVIIPAAHKRQIKLQLINLGIDPSLLYPGLQGIGARIAAIVELDTYGDRGLY
jgi:hypothetical protein